MVKKQTTLGIIAGNGALPQTVAEACERQKKPVFVVALKGHANAELLQKYKGCSIRLGEIGKAIRLLKKNDIKDIVFIGGVRRPSIAEICPDFKALMMLIKVGFRLLGDDNLLRIILDEAKKNGFNVLGVDKVLPELLAPKGIYGAVKPTDTDLKDIKQGCRVAKLLGEADVGQAVIVQNGLVLAVEGIEGTAELIKRTALLKRKGKGGVLVKVSKPQQDRRIDLPTIGPDTVRSIHQAGFRGIAVESGSSLLVQADKMIQVANELGIFIMGVSCNR